MQVYFILAPDDYFIRIRTTFSPSSKALSNKYLFVLYKPYKMKFERIKFARFYVQNIYLLLLLLIYYLCARICCLLLIM